MCVTLKITFAKALVSAAVLVGIVTTSCGCMAGVSNSDNATPATTPTASATTGVALPQEYAGFDYQLGGPYPPPEGVSIVERDRTATPAGLGYDICYVNGFQTQPSESHEFARQHPELVLHADGGPLVDPGWPDEYLFDTSSVAKRDALAAIVGAWIRGCKKSGFDAVEIDNLDSYTRSHGALTVDDNMALAAQYAHLAHDAGLAIAQKNTADQTARLKKAGYDFAVTESCHFYAECDAYTSAYVVVLDIEYTDEMTGHAFDDACRDSVRSPRAPVMILRDHDLVAPGDDGYTYRACSR